VLRLPSVRNNLTKRILPEADLHRLLTLEPNERHRVLLLLQAWSSGLSVNCAGFDHRLGAGLFSSKPSLRNLRAAPLV
jgi:hypothetical protein